jgi:hypothetical protein
MRTIRRLWILVLAGVLLGALGTVLLVGLPEGQRQARATAEPRAVVVRALTVPAGAFVPTATTWNMVQTGYELILNSGIGKFTAPVFFGPQTVTIRKITLYAWDNADGEVCVHLYRSTPATGSTQEIGEVCSSGAAVGVRSFVEDSLMVPQITGAYGPYLTLELPGSFPGHRFYAVKINYSYDTGT